VIMIIYSLQDLFTKFMNKKKKIKHNIIIFSILILLLSGVYIYNFYIRIHTVKRKVPDLFDTIFEITIQGKNSYKINSIINDIILKIKNQEILLNYFDEKSELFEINNNYKSGDIIFLSDTMYHLFKIGYEYEKMSERKFSILMGNFKNIYDEIFYTGVIDKSKIVAQQRKWQKSKIVFIEDNKIQIIGDASVDLGSFAKGWVVDVITEFLVEQKNIYSGIINAGGELRVFSKNNSCKWRIGVQHPRDQSSFIHVYELYNGSIATSGDYQRFVVIDTKKFHHIIDTETGFPTKKNISATVLTEKCIDADILSTLFFTMSTTEIDNFLNTNNISADYLIVDSNKKISQNNFF
jgi:FAD:protein FMN transferase